MNHIITDPFGVDEKRKVEFDYSAYLPISATISSALATSTVYSGNDSTPDIVNGSPSISGPVVSQMIGGDGKKGTLGVIYGVEMAATLSDGQIIPMSTYIAFVPSLLGEGGGGGDGGEPSEGFVLDVNSAITLPDLPADGTFVALESEMGTLGEDVVFGNLIFLQTDTLWYKANATVVATSGFVKLGVATVTATAGTEILVLLWGKIRADALYPSLTVGKAIYASLTSGLITQTQPALTDQVQRIIGFGNTEHEMHFRPSNDHTTHV